MRGTLPGLLSPHPIGETLPALYRDDPFTQSLCAGLDETLSPVLAVLDNLPAYLDLATTPPDMLAWLAQWVGMAVGPDLPAERQRELLGVATELHGWQGTAHGIQLAVEAIFGFPVEVWESGGATWSADPHAPLPGEPVPSLVVRITAGAAADGDLERVDAFVAGIKPGHVLHRVQIV